MVDVDGRGTFHAFCCINWAESRIARYDENGKCLWVSDKHLSRSGDESRLPVLDLDGDGTLEVLSVSEYTKKGGGAILCFDGDGLDEIFVNTNHLMTAFRGDGTLLWQDTTQRNHTDFIGCADVDDDGRVEVVYDHEGCSAQKGPIYIADALTGDIENKIDYRAVKCATSHMPLVFALLPALGFLCYNRCAG